MAKLVWRYNDDERGVIESVYKFYEGQKESGKKLTGISRWSGQKILQEMKKDTGKAATAKATSKVSLDDFDQCVVRRTIASMYSVNKV